MAEGEGKLEKARTKPFLKLTKEFFYSSQIRKMENQLGKDSSWFELNLLRMEFYLVTEWNEEGLEGYFPDNEESLDQLAFDIHFPPDGEVTFPEFLEVLVNFGFVERLELEGKGFLFFPRIVENQMTINKRKADCRKGGIESGKARGTNKAERKGNLVPTIGQVQGYPKILFPGLNPTEIDLYSDSFFQEQERNEWKGNWRELLHTFVDNQQALCPA